MSASLCSDYAATYSATAKGHTRVFASMLVPAIKIKLVTAAQAEPLQILDVTTGGGVAAEASLLTFPSSTRVVATDFAE